MSLTLLIRRADGHWTEDLHQTARVQIAVASARRTHMAVHARE